MMIHSDLLAVFRLVVNLKQPRGLGLIYSVLFKYFPKKLNSFFPDTCVACGHVVSKHCHEFWLEDGYQEYRMECSLCGLGEDSVSILPKDPKKVSQIPL
jgi:hypothetical protein